MITMTIQLHLKFSLYKHQPLVYEATGKNRKRQVPLLDPKQINPETRTTIYEYRSPRPECTRMVRLGRYALVLVFKLHSLIVSSS